MMIKMWVARRPSWPVCAGINKYQMTMIDIKVCGNSGGDQDDDDDDKDVIEDLVDQCAQV